MNKRPNFGLSNTAMAGTFALQQPGDSGWAVSKPFDGFKTNQNNASKRPFDFRGGKPSATDYSQPMGHAALEKNLVKNIQNLDWELKTVGNPKPQMQSEANIKPKLFMKKNHFNDTGETKATVGALTDDWDLPDNKVVTRKPVPTIKEGTAEVSDWNLGGVSSPPQKGKATRATK